MIANMGKVDSSMKMGSGIKVISSRIKLRVKVKSTTMMVLFIKEFFLTTNQMDEARKFMQMVLNLWGNLYKAKRNKVNSAGLMGQNT